MNKFIEIMQKFFMPIAAKLNKNRYVKAVRDGVVLSLSYTMVASLLSLLGSISFLQKLLGESATQAMQSFIQPSSTMTNMIIALFVVIGVANSLAKEYGINPLHGSMTCMVMFLINCPSTVWSDDGVEISNALSLDYVGPKAIFCAIIMAVIGMEVFKWAIQHKLTLNLPGSVPDFHRT